MFLAYLVTKHLSTSSCLQTNSMNRGEVMLDIREGERVCRVSDLAMRAHKSCIN